MMFAFILGTIFGMLLGMVLNHAIEESERRKDEADKLRTMVKQMREDRWTRGGK